MANSVPSISAPHPWIAVLILSVSSPAVGALPADDLKSLDTNFGTVQYIDSLAIAKQAEYCSARQKNYRDRFDPAFEKWKSLYATPLARGEAIVRRKLAEAGADFDQYVAALVERKTAPLKSRNNGLCDAILHKLGL